MKIHRFLICLFLAAAIPAPAQTVPSGMTYQGRLTDASSAPVPDGTGYEVEVRLWSAPTGGTLLWGTRYTGVPLKSGAFNLILGSGGTPIPGATHTDLKAAFNTPTVHLGLTTTKSATGATIPSPTEILPRQQIFSTPYAFRAQTAAVAESAQTDSILSAAIKDGEVKTDDLAISAVQTGQLADQAVNSAKIADASVLSQDIAIEAILPSRLYHDFAIIVDEKPTNTPGGATSAGNWVKRDLNTISSSNGSSITLANNSMTLATGTYMIECRTPAYQTLVTRSVLRRVGSTTPVLYGNSIRLLNGVTGFCSFEGVVTVTGATETFEVWQYAEVAHSTHGLGHPVNTSPIPEIYTTVKAVRLK